MATLLWYQKIKSGTEKRDTRLAPKREDLDSCMAQLRELLKKAFHEYNQLVKSRRLALREMPVQVAIGSRMLGVFVRGYCADCRWPRGELARRAGVPDWWATVLEAGALLPSDLDKAYLKQVEDAISKLVPDFRKVCLSELAHDLMQRIPDIVLDWPVWTLEKPSSTSN